MNGSQNSISLHPFFVVVSCFICQRQKQINSKPTDKYRFFFHVCFSIFRCHCHRFLLFLMKLLSSLMLFFFFFFSTSFFCLSYFSSSSFSTSSTASLAEWPRRPPRERKIPGSNPACAGIFWVESCSDLKIGTPVATLPGAWRYRVSAGTVGPVSVYCDWVRWKVWSATSISVWQHVKLSSQIRP